MPTTTQRIELIPFHLQAFSLVGMLHKLINPEWLRIWKDCCIHVGCVDISKHILSLLYQYHPIPDPQLKVAVGLTYPRMQPREPHGLHDCRCQ